MSSLCNQNSAETLVKDRFNDLSTARKLAFLIIIFCAKFLVIFNTSGFYSAIPTLSAYLGFTESQSVWIISAFQLTYASFLLISGRISDVYGPKIVLIGGIAGLSVTSLGGGFANDKILMIVLRALSGIAASMTDPSALALLVNMYPDPLPKARALGLYAGFGALSSTPALFIGAVLIDSVSYRWLFWFITILAAPIALAGFFIIPPQMAETAGCTSLAPSSPSTAKWKKLDLVGVSIITVALTMFVFSITSGSTNGWASTTVLVTLIISIVMVVGFFYWETFVLAENAAIPPQTWFYNNFSVLFALSFVRILWWTAVAVTLTSWWQNTFHWSIILSAVYMIPVGTAAFAVGIAGGFFRICNPKWIILTGLTLYMVAAALLAVGGGKPENYWPFVFPAFALGSAGAVLVLAQANIAMLQGVPSSMVGTVGAIFSGATQSGSAIGLAVMSSIETSVEATHGGSNEYNGRAASFWFLVALIGVEFISMSIFYDRRVDSKLQPQNDKQVDPVQNNTHYHQQLDGTQP